ncbi:hypothetical protein LNAOJCKE_0407 [Methylorubrum aminovorans]|uniref:Uncharacterized protein n=1 Tax=Methylorubrum aminovorans TaxID=269069 RepID=A0ABQ4U864_9HYPH|nr:hypothetical protein [Methylorubrum aminovorans]GJE63213.1 hypothetical protein LNAOJCKE_0407 [Methylorubrum aminovorans]GMA79256.1 hypothetical protein GCM10025880_56730 [Methylorubrum aminovorans]
MALKKLSELDDGGLITAGDQLLIARSGENYKIDGAQIAETVTRVEALETGVITPSHRGPWSLGYSYRTFTFEDGVLPAGWTFDKPGHTFVPNGDAANTVLRFPPLPGEIGGSTGLAVPFTSTLAFNEYSIRYRVSSEGPDKLRVSIDGGPYVIDVGGEQVAYTDFTGTVVPGSHTISLLYSRDSSVVRGDDTVYISSIRIPVAEDKVYHYGDTVSHNGKTYLCAKEGTIATPGAGTEWIEFAVPSSGGGGGMSLFPIKPPVPADFTVVAGRDFTSITASPSFTSFRRGFNGESGAQLAAYRGIPLTGATWEVTATIRIPLRHGSTTGLTGIAVRDTAGKLYEFGIEANSNSPQLSILRMSDNGTNYVGSGGSVSGMARFEWYTMRMSKTANFFDFEFSPDYGLTWERHQSYSLNDHLGAVESVGLVMQTYGFSAADSLVCAYWDLKYT